MPVELKQEVMAGMHMAQMSQMSQMAGRQMMPQHMYNHMGSYVPPGMAVSMAQRMPNYPPPQYRMTGYPPQQMRHHGIPPGYPHPPMQQQYPQPQPLPQIQAQTEPEQNGKEATGEGQIDSASFRGAFGWATIDSVNFPYILRDDKKYTAVRMVEMKLLSKYPSTYPDELKERAPLMSHYITAKEGDLLNEINREHCAYEYGNQAFTEQDLIVKLTDFEEFYTIVKKHFPDEVLRSMELEAPKAKVDGGWLQINNTVVPYVLRDSIRYVPLSVIRYAAGLLTDIQVEGFSPFDEECDYLNEMCQTAGLSFSFAKTTKFITVDTINERSDSPIEVLELPRKDPFGHAEYKGNPEEDKARFGHQGPPPGGMMLNNMVQRPGPGPGMPMMGVSGPGISAERMGMRPDGSPMWMNPHLGIYPGMPAQQMMPPYGMPPGVASYNMHPPRQVAPKTSEVNNNIMQNRTMTSPLTVNTGAGGRDGTGSRPQSGSSCGSSSGAIQQRMGQTTSPPSASPTGMVQGMVRPGMNGAPTGIPNLEWHPNPAEYHQLMMQVQQGLVPPNHPAVQAIQREMMMRARAPSAALGRPPPTATQLTHKQMSQAKDSPSPRQSPSLAAKAPTSTSVAASVLPQALSPRASPPRASPPRASLQATPPLSQNTRPVHSPRRPHKEGKIKAVEFHGKTLSCILKGASLDPYALVEAVARVYFPFCQLKDFQFALENVLAVSVMTLSVEEEKLFITFYGLPVSCLSCNKIVKLKDLEDYLPQLKYMFREKAEEFAKQQKEKESGSPRTDRVSIPAHMQTKNVSIGDLVANSASATTDNGHINGRRDSNASTGSTDSGVSSDSQFPKKMNVNFDTFKKRAQSILRDIMGSNKRVADESSQAPTAKKPCQRLEDAVNRLYQNRVKDQDQNDSQTEDSNPSTPDPPAKKPATPQSPDVSQVAPNPVVHVVAESVPQVPDISPSPEVHTVADIVSQVGDISPSPEVHTVADIVSQVDDISPSPVVHTIADIVSHVDDISPSPVVHTIADIVSQVDDISPSPVVHTIADIVPQVADISPSPVIHAVADIVSQVGDISPSPVIHVADIVSQVGDISPSPVVHTIADSVPQVADISPSPVVHTIADSVPQVADISPNPEVHTVADIVPHVADISPNPVVHAVANIVSQVGDISPSPVIHGVSDIVPQVGDISPSPIIHGVSDIVSQVGDISPSPVVHAVANIVSQVGDISPSLVIHGVSDIVPQVGDISPSPIIHGVSDIVSQVGDISPSPVIYGVSDSVPQVADISPNPEVHTIADSVPQVADISPNPEVHTIADSVPQVGDISPSPEVHTVADIVSQVANISPSPIIHGVSDIVSQVADISPSPVIYGVSDIVSQVADISPSPVIHRVSDIVSQVGDISPSPVIHGVSDIVSQVGDISPSPVIHGVSDIVSQVADISPSPVIYGLAEIVPTENSEESHSVVSMEESVMTGNPLDGQVESVIADDTKDGSSIPSESQTPVTIKTNGSIITIE